MLAALRATHPGVALTESDTQATVAHDVSAELRTFRRYDEIANDLRGLEGTVFQSRHWLTNWLAVFGADPAIEPYLVVLRDAAGESVLALPLVRRSEGLIRVIETPDCGVTDYTAPLLSRARRHVLPEGQALWDLVLAALPPADLLRLFRMVPQVAGMSNPLYAHPAARRDRLAGWVLAFPASWDAYRASLKPSYLEKVDKAIRRFARQPDAVSGIIGDPAEALAALDQLDAMQEARAQQTGAAFRLREAGRARFYRELVRTGLATGETRLVRMTIAGRSVALNFYVRAGDQMVYLRMANDMQECAKLSLGMVITERALRDAFDAGMHVFDFSIGNYDYKRRFGGKAMALCNLVLPRSSKGLPFALAWHARDRLSKSSLLRRLTGRDPFPPES